MSSFDTKGAHWVYYKNYKSKYFFYSYEKLIDKRINQLVKCLGKDNVFFNYNQT